MQNVDAKYVELPNTTPRHINNYHLIKQITREPVTQNVPDQTQNTNVGVVGKT